MTRLPAFVVSALAAATVGAFFVVQHLKTTTPLIQRFLGPTPAVFNPLTGVKCGGTDYRQTTFSFFLQHRSDDVDVWIINQAGDIVATVASGVHIPRYKRRKFFWTGVEDNGTYAPDGTYFVKLGLRNQGRTYIVSQPGNGPPIPLRIETHAPQPVVRSVSPSLVPYYGLMNVKIHYAGNEGHPGTIRLYRTDLPGAPRLVKSFLTPGRGSTAIWDGKIAQKPAPAGTYLVGLEVTDAACNTGRFPSRWPPTPGSTPHAGVSVRYLAAAPPLTPVAAGSRATVLVDSRLRPYGWALRRAGSRKILERASIAHANSLAVRLPRGGGGLYELSLRYGQNATTVPIESYASRRAPVLVVLPALSWQGLNPVDETGDGLPSTLSLGLPVSIGRPLAAGLPAGFGEEAALVEYLIRTHRRFDLTTDLGLFYGIGPKLGGHRGVILDGAELWIPPALAGQLRTYVLQGGNLLSFGRDSLRSYVDITDGLAKAPRYARAPALDIFGIRHGPSVANHAGIVGALTDGLGVFAGTAGLLTGYSAYEPILGAAPPARLVTEAGTSASAISIAGVQLGRGSVVEVGLQGFIARLATDPNTHDVFDAMWSLLGGGS